MKRSIVRYILSLIVGTIVILLFLIVPKRERALSKVRQIPVIDALTVYGDKFVSSEYLDSSKRTAIFFFHPECEYCQIELEGILTRNKECRNVQWLFLTLASEEIVESFLLDYPLETIPNSYVIREDWPDTYGQFGVKNPPALFVYNENGILINWHMGATSINTIVQELQ